MKFIDSLPRTAADETSVTNSMGAKYFWNVPTMAKSWIDGLIAMLDAAGSECATVFATAESGLPAMLLTASHPHRVRSLVLWGAFARFSRGPGYPFGMPGPTLSECVDAVGEAFGTGAIADVLAPSWIDHGQRRR